MPNFDRMEQALWDTFNGTKQPHVETGLPLWLDEIGWQVPTEGSDAYTGVEDVSTVDEAGQARSTARSFGSARATRSSRRPFLPLDRRVGPGAISERRLPRRRYAAPRVRSCRAGDRRHERRHVVPRECRRLEAHELGRRREGDVHAASGTCDRGECPRECDCDVGLVDVATKRTLTASEKKAVSSALALRSSRSVRARFGAVFDTLDPSSAHSNASRTSSRTTQVEPLHVRTLDRRRVQPQQNVALRRPELRCRGSPQPRRRPPDRCCRFGAISGAVKARSAPRSRRGSNTARG